MSRPRKKREPERDLFGPVPKRIPKRKPIERSDGRGWDIGVWQSGTAYIGLGAIYATEGEAWQAIKAGVGLTAPLAETVSVAIYVNRTNRRK